MRKGKVGPINVQKVLPRVSQGDVASSPNLVARVAQEVGRDASASPPRHRAGQSTKQLLEQLKKRREVAKIASVRKGSATSSQGAGAADGPASGVSVIAEGRGSRQPGAVRVSDFLAEEPYDLSINYLNWMMKSTWNRNNPNGPRSPTVRETKEDDEAVKGASMNIPSQSQMSMRFRFNVLETDYSKHI